MQQEVKSEFDLNESVNPLISDLPKIVRFQQHWNSDLNSVTFLQTSQRSLWIDSFIVTL